MLVSVTSPIALCMYNFVFKSILPYYIAFLLNSVALLYKAYLYFPSTKQIQFGLENTLNYVKMIGSKNKVVTSAYNTILFNERMREHH